MTGVWIRHVSIRCRRGLGSNASRTTPFGQAAAGSTAFEIAASGRLPEQSGGPQAYCGLRLSRPKAPALLQAINLLARERS